jgi:hypothetical protein
MKNNKRPYDLGYNGGLSQLKEKLYEQIQKQEDKKRDSFPYKPRKIPWRP